MSIYWMEQDWPSEDPYEAKQKDIAKKLKELADSSLSEDEIRCELDDIAYEIMKEFQEEEPV